MVEPVFPAAEFTGRIDRVRRLMDARSIAGVLLTGGLNLTYLTGYPCPPRGGPRPFVYLLPLAGEPILIVHTWYELDARRKTHLRDIRTYATLSDAPLPEIVAALHDAGLEHGRLAAEIGPEQAIDLPFADFVQLQGRLPNVEWVDAGSLVMAARMRKTPAEIACMREACRITSRAYELLFPALVAGMTEIEVARLLHVASLELGAGATWELITAGPGNYDDATALPSARPIAPGDLVWLDAGCAVAGYWSDFGRAGVVGGATAEQRDAQARLHEITTRGVEAIGPGTTTGEVARVCNAALANLDLPVTATISGLAGRVGHGLGLGDHRAAARCRGRPDGARAGHGDHGRAGNRHTLRHLSRRGERARDRDRPRGAVNDGAGVVRDRSRWRVRCGTSAAGVEASAEDDDGYDEQG